jgi:DNA-nicking Smr family endonuclease
VSRKRPLVTPEEQALFLEAIGGVTPLAGRERVPPPRPPTSVARVEVLPPEIKLTVEGDAQRYSARAPGVSLAQIGELRRGRVHVEETLDLHGETVEKGIARLRTFLVQASRIGRRCVLVVHGKGTHSDHGAPLREAVLAELLGPCSGFVHALSTAAPADGDDGATYVMLRGRR